jgi:diguanylate cyclase (GGDEF)-like protein
MLFAHGALFAVRSPFDALLNLAPNSEIAMSGWLDLLSLESLLFAIAVAFILLAMAKERTERRHRTEAGTDVLTGIANRRGFLEHAILPRRNGMEIPAVAVLLFDLDRFKAVNDRHGHAVGDRALQLFADTAKALIGSDGMIGRWGGDEFVAVLYATTNERAANLAERIKLAYEAAAADIDGTPVRGTVSTGMVFSEAGSFDLPALLLRADQALYRAKQNGRNCLEIAMPDAAPPRSAAQADRPRSAFERPTAA